MTTYERVTFQEPRARSFTVVLRDVLETEADGVQVLAGLEVNRAGELVSGPGFDQRQRIIGRTLITKRTPMTMNLTYGVLEPVAD